MSDEAEPLELAEGKKENETWLELIERQRGGDKPDSFQERLRSLPLEQKQEKGRGELDQAPLYIETELSYDAMLKQAAQRAGPEQGRGIDR
jgi:hypothetical protein